MSGVPSRLGIDFISISPFCAPASPPPAMRELDSLGGRAHAPRTQTMKHIIPVITISGLLLCLVGCSKPIAESSLIGTWQFDTEHSIMLLATNHTFTLKLEDGSSTLGGDWRLEGSRLITTGQIYTNGSMVIRAAKNNDTKITELTDSRMVLQNWGGPVSSLTRVVPSH